MGQWLFGSRFLGRISPWNERIAARHAAATERMLLGSCGRAQIVGYRRKEGRAADAAATGEPMPRLVRGGVLRETWAR